MKCCICQKGIKDVKSLHRVNEKGVTGVWACEKHIAIFPAKQPDEETIEITRILSCDISEDGSR